MFPCALQIWKGAAPSLFPLATFFFCFLFVPRYRLSIGFLSYVGSGSSFLGSFVFVNCPVGGVNVLFYVALGTVETVGTVGIFIFFDLLLLGILFCFAFSPRVSFLCC